jgi:DNA-binding XRE family transcriptional regulator
MACAVRFGVHCGNRAGLKQPHCGSDLTRGSEHSSLNRLLGQWHNPMPVTSAQVRMARAALNWTVRDLAKATGLHRNTINNFETGRFGGDDVTLRKIESVLAAAGIEFIAENGGGPGVRLRKSR